MVPDPRSRTQFSFVHLPHPQIRSDRHPQIAPNCHSYSILVLRPDLSLFARNPNFCDRTRHTFLLIPAPPSSPQKLWNFQRPPPLTATTGTAAAATEAATFHLQQPGISLLVSFHPLSRYPCPTSSFPGPLASTDLSQIPTQSTTKPAPGLPPRPTYIPAPVPPTLEPNCQLDLKATALHSRNAEYNPKVCVVFRPQYMN